jgi:hypothetical protein
MIDIVGRLRHGFLDPIMGVWRSTPLDMEAAAEIERLREHVAELTAQNRVLWDAVNDANQIEQRN